MLGNNILGLRKSIIKMSSELQDDNVFIQIRDKLQKDGIKLWLEPYFLPSSQSAEIELRVIDKVFSNLHALNCIS